MFPSRVEATFANALYVVGQQTYLYMCLLFVVASLTDKEQRHNQGQRQHEKDNGATHVGNEQLLYTFKLCGCTTFYIAWRVYRCVPVNMLNLYSRFSHPHTDADVQNESFFKMTKNEFF